MFIRALSKIPNFLEEKKVFENTSPNFIIFFGKRCLRKYIFEIFHFLVLEIFRICVSEKTQ